MGRTYKIKKIMTQEALLEQIKTEHEKNKKVEKRIRNWLIAIVMTFGVGSISLFGKVMVMSNNIGQITHQQNEIKSSYVSQESFVLFNRTYELQLKETQATINGNEKKLEKIQEKYNELRNMIVETPQYRGEGSQK